MPSEASSEPASHPDLDQISAEELLDEAHRLETEDIMSEITPLLEKESVTLNLDEKEARIISAMEEVAALMPPGPAKKFVEDMMLKRAADVHPRIPQKNED